MSFLFLAQASFDRERHLPLLLEADDVEEHIRAGTSIKASSSRSARPTH